MAGKAPTIEERAERARQGSRRKRDLEALEAIDGAARSETALQARAAIEPDAEADAAWAATVAAISHHVSASSLDSWFAPVRCIGATEGRVCLEGPQRVIDWFARRYQPMAVATLRDVSQFEGVELFGEAA